MLVRIGDEKREVLETHMNVLKTKIAKTDDYLVETRDEMLQQFVKVVTNLPHKVKIYAGVLYLIATENAELAAGIVTELMPLMIQVSFSKGDQFKCRNVSSWVGQLHKYGLLSEEAFQKFFSQLRVAGLPRGLLLECLVASQCTLDQAEIESYKSQVLETYESMLRLENVGFRAVQT